jgi:hypothetical protein
MNTYYCTACERVCDEEDTTAIDNGVGRSDFDRCCVRCHEAVFELCNVCEGDGCEWCSGKGYCA